MKVDLNNKLVVLKGNDLGFVQILLPIVGATTAVGTAIYNMFQSSKQAKLQEELARKQIEVQTQIEKEKIQMIFKLAIIIVIVLVISLLLKKKESK